MGTFNRAANIGTFVVDASKLSVQEPSYNGIDGSPTITRDDSTYPNGTTLDPDITTGEDQAETYTITNSAVNVNKVDLTGDTIWYVDLTAVTQNTKGLMFFTVEETI